MERPVDLDELPDVREPDPDAREDFAVLLVELVRVGRGGEDARVAMVEG